ncbi:anti-sigma factor antagonist [Streptomyces rubradiris]|uniref:Anti-sigma factor antagonist n=1 Tax=Streptomyces rubradiris TaxID=285531 RepID=A0ABQ3RFY6_STRRR|nr:anti-sigma factor antagonist [Streptomyces rubradiris]GHI54769.1 anti-sigma factor antagonist [Streptomyces rubradiris]
MLVEEGVSDRPGGAGGTPPRIADQAAVAQSECRGVLVISAHGAYDMCSVKPLAEALDAAAKAHRTVVLDASGITFGDSSLLNLLILTHHETDLRVAAPTRQIRRLLEITGADTFLKVRETVEEAAACH